MNSAICTIHFKRSILGGAFFFSEMSLRSSLYSQYYIKLAVGPAKKLVGTK